MSEKIDQCRGFIALTTILIMGALMLSIGIGLTLRAISEGDMSSGAEFSARAKALAEACAETAVFRLKNNLSYSGNETIIVIGSDTCDILSVEGIGNSNRVIKTQSAVMGYKRKIKVVIAQVSPLQISQWGLAGDF